MRNETRKILVGNAIETEQNKGNKANISYCLCCGKPIDNKTSVFRQIASRVNGGHIHTECLYHSTSKVEYIGNKQSKNANYTIEFTSPREIDIMFYIASCGLFNVNIDDTQNIVKSPLIINSSAINKIISGLVAYGLNNSIIVRFNNLTLTTKPNKTNDAIILAQKLLAMTNKQGKPYARCLEELEAIATLEW